jgi:hypothetical protein
MARKLLHVRVGLGAKGVLAWLASLPTSTPYPSLPTEAKGVLKLVAGC